MSLSNFFRINMPYGMKRNDSGEWLVFNREYMPLGWNSIQYQDSIHRDNVYADKGPLYTRYEGLTESKLLKIAEVQTGRYGVMKNSVGRDKNGDINIIFFYSDRTNPTNDASFWPQYMDRLKMLATLERAEVILK